MVSHGLSKELTLACFLDIMKGRWESLEEVRVVERWEEISHGDQMGLTSQFKMSEGLWKSFSYPVQGGKPGGNESMIHWSLLQFSSELGHLSWEIVKAIRLSREDHSLDSLLYQLIIKPPPKSDLCKLVGPHIEELRVYSALDIPPLHHDLMIKTCHLLPVGFQRCEYLTL